MERSKILMFAEINLEDKDIYSSVENNTLYVNIMDVLLELSEDEIRFQCNEYIQYKIEDYSNDIYNLIGKAPTLEGARKAFKLHEQGNGGNTVGWHFVELYKIDQDLSEGEVEYLGDLLIDLGRFLTEC
jgi:hypothetical protein